MALKRNERYPGRFDNPSANHPQGAFKNRTSPSAQDGSYLEADWANDWSGFFERLLSVAGVTANGSADTAQASQYFDALVAAVKANLGTAAQRNVGTGTNQIPDVNSFISGSGYEKFPNGLMLQYGLASNATAGAISVTFPMPYVQSVFYVNTIPIVATPAGYDVTTLSSLSNSGFTVNRMSSSSTGAASASNFQIRWMSMGR